MPWVPAGARAFQATCSGVAACAAFDHRSSDGYCRLLGEGMTASTPGLDGWKYYPGNVKSGDYTVTKVLEYSGGMCRVKDAPGEGRRRGRGRGLRNTRALGGGWRPCLPDVRPPPPPLLLLTRRPLAYRACRAHVPPLAPHVGTHNRFLSLSLSLFLFLSLSLSLFLSLSLSLCGACLTEDGGGPSCE